MKILIMTLLIILYLLLGAAFMAHSFYTSGEDGEPFTWNDIGVAIIGILIWLPWTIGYICMHFYLLLKSKIKKK